jgi:DNA primase
MTESPSLGGVGEAINPLYPKERLIVQQLIRHGEKVMFIDEETQQQVLVAEYVASELEMDEITFTTPLFDEVLRELQQHLGEEGFVAERHFVNHANPELSRLAVDLIEEKYQLSKYHSKTQTVVREVDRLSELVSHLMVDYKHSLVELELKDTLNKLRQPDVMSDAEKCLEVMSRYKELMEIKQQMAKHLGDRVIG